MDLLNRALLCLDGADALALLQKLVTQDLGANSAGYTLFLTPQGRYVFDFFVVPYGGAVYVDIAAHQAEALATTLNKYKLRSDVSITRVTPAGFALTLQPSSGDALLAYADPRHADLGWRVWQAGESQAGNVIPADYKKILTRLGIVEPAYELQSGTDLPLEFGLHKCNAVSFTKGCFLGQELTARTHHKGLIKHAIIVVESTHALATGAPVCSSGSTVVGRILRSETPYALAQVKVENEGDALFTVDGAPVTALNR